MNHSDSEFARLQRIVARLRAPDGCPWDRQQTVKTMAPHLLEEAFEAMDAVVAGDDDSTCKELGDVLLNVLMIAQIASEAGRFDLEDIARDISDKLVRRHPHVFGDLDEQDPEKVLANWEAIKRTEGGSTPKSVLGGVPESLPALLRARRVGEKAARVGFDWPDRSGPRAKLDEELGELDAELARLTGDEAHDHPNKARAEEELGDVLFSLVNLARHHGLDPESALRGTVQRFCTRFHHVEGELGARLKDADLPTLEAAWQAAKAAIDGPRDPGPPST